MPRTKNPTQMITDAQIAVLAYERWLARGCPISDGADDWYAARTTLEAQGGKTTVRVASRKTAKPKPTRASAAAS